jgi:peroxiredoxin
MLFMLVAVLMVTSDTEAVQAQPDTSSNSLVQSRLQGRITVSAEVDSIPDYRGFEVLVVRQAPDGAVDTLGYDVTNQQGAFATDVYAPGPGIYPLIVRRRGSTVAATDYVIAEGDSAEVEMELPLRRPITIRSTENSAWTAYQNTMALHREALIQNLRDTTQTNPEGSMESRIQQTAQVLWSMRTTYPNTLGAAQSMAESITLLEGWNDSLVVARSKTIPPTNPRYVEVARAARRAAARLDGQAEALDVLRQLQEKALSPNQKAALQAEVVRAHIDSLEQDEALAAARSLAREYPDTPWSAWAERAEYEVANLLPGMTAPVFQATTWEGEALSLTDLRGQPVVLEFYQPSNELYRGQLARRNALYEATRPADLRMISVSLQPDTLLNEAFFEGRELPGTHVVATEDLARELIEKYNIGSLPTRLFIDASGRIVDKYVGSAFSRLQEDALTRLEVTPPPN